MCSKKNDIYYSLIHSPKCYECFATIEDCEEGLIFLERLKKIANFITQKETDDKVANYCENDVIALQDVCNIFMERKDQK